MMFCQPRIKSMYSNIRISTNLRTWYNMIKYENPCTQILVYQPRIWYSTRPYQVQGSLWCYSSSSDSWDGNAMQCGTGNHRMCQSNEDIWWWWWWWWYHWNMRIHTYIYISSSSSDVSLMMILMIDHPLNGCTESLLWNPTELQSTWCSHHVAATQWVTR